MNARRRLDVVRRHGFTADRDVPAYRACPNARNPTRLVAELAEFAESHVGLERWSWLPRRGADATPTESPPPLFMPTSHVASVAP